MEFKVRRYRLVDRCSVKTVSIETVDGGKNVRLAIESLGEYTSVDIPKEVAVCIRDNLNTYLDE